MLGVVSLWFMGLNALWSVSNVWHEDSEASHPVVLSKSVGACKSPYWCATVHTHAGWHKCVAFVNMMQTWEMCQRACVRNVSESLRVLGADTKITPLNGNADGKLCRGLSSCKLYDDLEVSSRSSSELLRTLHCYSLFLCFPVFMFLLFTLVSACCLNRCNISISSHVAHYRLVFQ